ncbi:MAG: hypothetical protein AAF591_22885 [Verrucomicrobiota bacterium]
MNEVTKEEIAQLPRWAMVAFAARCARRLLRPDSDERVVRAVEIAEEYAAAAATPDHAANLYAAYNAKAAYNAAYNAYNAAYPDRAKAAAKAAAHAAHAAAAAKAATVTAHAATYATYAYYAAEVRKDFDFLLAKAKAEGWDENTRVPPTVFPPLGISTELLIEMDPGNATPAEIAAVFSKLNALYRAHGGSGLTFKPDGTSIAAVREEVPA